MTTVPYGDRDGAWSKAIMGAIKKGGLFAVDVDIVPTKIGEAWPCLAAGGDLGRGEPHSMNGERRMRLTERYMDPPGQAMPGLPDRRPHRPSLERVLARAGQAGHRRQVQGLRLEDRRRRLHGWLPQACEGRRVRHLRAAARRWAPTASRSRRPASRTARSSAPSACTPTASSRRKDGKAKFMATAMARAQAPGKERRRRNSVSSINNGRANNVWQRAYLDQDNEFVMDRCPYPLHPDEPGGHGRARLKRGRSGRGLQRQRLDPGDGLSDADRASRKQTFMLFAYPTGVQGNVVSQGVNEFDHPELQADLGQHPQDRGRPAGRRGTCPSRSEEYKAT